MSEDGAVRPSTATAGAHAATSGVAGLLALLVLRGFGDGLSIDRPLTLYVGLGIGITAAVLLTRYVARADVAFAIASSGGMALLTAFVVDVSPGVELAVWWPLWGLHAVTTAYSLVGWPRAATNAVGLGTMLVAVVETGTPAATAVLHVGSYAVLAALVVQLARHHDEIRTEHQAAAETVASRTRLLSTLARMNSLDLADVAEEAVRGLAAAGYEIGTFGAVDPASGVVHSLASIGFGDAGDPTPVPIDAGLAGEAFRAGRTVVVEDYDRWSGRIDARDGIGAAVGVPVLVDGEPAAVLLGGREHAGAPTSGQLEVIEILAAQAARVLLNAQRFRERQRSAERLRELDNLKDDFIASVTHELRTPLTIIQGVGETLHLRRDDVPPELRDLLLVRLIEQSERLDDLVSALLYLSRLEAGSVRPELGGVAAAHLVDVAVARATARNDHPVSRAVDPALLVECDGDLITRVLEQLVTNAIVHNPADTNVSVRATLAAGGVGFSVVDDGSGIAAADARHLTQRFFRGGPSTRRTSSGLGLGLAVAEHLLGIHDSELRIDSTPGVGTTASFVLPSGSDARAASDEISPG